MEEHLAIKLDSVTKEYPGVMALKNVNLKIKKQSIHGFLGPNGAGKSTTMKIISGLIPPTSGIVEVMGMEVQNNLSNVNSLIGFLPENPPLYKNMRVRDFLEFVYSINCRDRSEMKKAVDRVLDTCSLSLVSNRFIGHLSKGYKQRVGMAQALVYNPPILIFDEPTVGLDPQALDEIRSLIKKLSFDHTILLSTHLLHEVSLICSDISIINHGVVVKEGSLGEIENSLQTQQTINAEVQLWNKHIEQKLREHFQVTNFKVDLDDGRYFLEISIAESRDQREELSRLLFENNCGVLAFNSKKIDLEDVFKQSTKIAEQEVMQ